MSLSCCPHLALPTCEAARALSVVNSPSIRGLKKRKKGYSCTARLPMLQCAQKLEARLSLGGVLHISSWHSATGQPCTELYCRVVQLNLQQGCLAQSQMRAAGQCLTFMRDRRADVASDSLSSVSLAATSGHSSMQASYAPSRVQAVLSLARSRSERPGLAASSKSPAQTSTT